MANLVVNVPLKTIKNHFTEYSARIFCKKVFHIIVFRAVCQHVFKRTWRRSNGRNRNKYHPQNEVQCFYSCIHLQTKTFRHNENYFMGEIPLPKHQPGLLPKTSVSPFCIAILSILPDLYCTSFAFYMN